jgi:hypothetical protein
MIEKILDATPDSPAVFRDGSSLVAGRKIQEVYPSVPDRINHLSFRNSRIIYYGPHECANCGVLIAKMGREWGGNAFTYPEEPIYPNTEWRPHVCDPKRVASLPKPMQCAPPKEPPAPEVPAWEPGPQA